MAEAIAIDWESKTAETVESVETAETVETAEIVGKKAEKAEKVKTLLKWMGCAPFILIGRILVPVKGKQKQLKS